MQDCSSEIIKKGGDVVRKNQIKTLSDNDLIKEYVKTYAHYDQNFVLRRGTEMLTKHLKDLEAELIRRNILTEDDVEELNR